MRNPKQSVNRRAALAGAGTVGALAAAAVVLPGVQQAAPAAPGASEPALPDGAAGYRLTEHIKRYYATARI
jgi:hypothetical protein